VSNKNQALAICSEFADEYGIDVHDNETIVVYINSKYVNELHPSLLMYCLNYNMRKKLIYTMSGIV
jgi:hypothetical protein